MGNVASVFFYLLITVWENLTSCKKKKTNELGPAWQNIVGNNRLPWQKKIAFSYSDPGDTLENKLNNLKHFYSRKKSFAFQKKLKKMLLHWKLNLADQNKQQPQEDACHILYMTSQYETNLWPLIDTFQYCSTSRANQTLRLLANAGFQNRGVCLQAFPSFPSPSPLFHFFGSRFISRVVKTEDPVCWGFFCSETKQKRLLSRLQGIYED